MMPPSDTSNELAAWLRLSLDTPLAGALRLLRHVGGPQKIFASPWDVLARHVEPALARRMAQPPSSQLAACIEQALQWHAQEEHAVLPISSPDYPPHLLTIGDAPLVLYVDGCIASLKQPGIAIVGARRATIQGCANARAFACELARQGVSVISGMAVGIDAAAHEGALAAGAGSAGTIAVTGTGLNITYPRAHAALAARIRQHGALVSELPLDMPARAHHFPMRNRIVAGLSKGVLVVEAAAQSGSLITARLGNETGREVFALPGSIHSPLARGCHELIRQGAKLVETTEDILNEFQGYPGSGNARSSADSTSSTRSGRLKRSPSTAATGMAGAAPATGRLAGTLSSASPLERAMGHDPLSLDALMAHTGLDSAELASQLLALEFSGTVVRLADGRYQRLRR